MCASHPTRVNNAKKESTFFFFFPWEKDQQSFDCLLPMMQSTFSLPSVDDLGDGNIQEIRSRRDLESCLDRRFRYACLCHCAVCPMRMRRKTSPKIALFSFPFTAVIIWKTSRYGKTKKTQNVKPNARRRKK